MKITPRRLRFLLNCYGPYLGAGVRITHIAPDWQELRVSMKLRWFNRNAVGTHFGGSLYSMVDPHVMLMLMKLLGRDYVVWDKAAHIDFVKAVKGPVRAVIRISPAEVSRIRELAADGTKHLPEFEIRIEDDAGDLVALVKKVLYVRLKSELRSA